MSRDRLLLRDVIGGFAPGRSLRSILLLTYTFDGVWLEEGLVPDLFEREVVSALVIRDGHSILREAPSVRYHRANAGHSRRVFHSKLALLVADDRALAIVGSANLTRGGLERNLELATSHEISPEGGPRSLFEGLRAYLDGPLLQEVEETAAESVRETCVALDEVLGSAPEEPKTERQLVFLHNYDRTLWEQLLEALPHRHVARVSIVSPFFEGDKAAPEDPRVGADDDGLFAAMFADLRFEPPEGEKPVTVYFQESGGVTLLPIEKLRKWQSRIALKHRLATSDDPRPLHAKLLVIEGAGGPKREPYLFALHGSPNFTPAAFLRSPPKGNAEIAVLTELPWKRANHAQAIAALQLKGLFGDVTDWGALRYKPDGRPPPPLLGSFQICDVSLRVVDAKLRLRFKGLHSHATTWNVLVQIDGQWTSLGSFLLEGVEAVEIDATGLLSVDEGGLLSLRASSIRVELCDPVGKVLVSRDAPVNVDQPAEFCGLARVGPLLATLDEKIAHTGCGAPKTYREQLDILQRRGEVVKGSKDPTALTHVADLDRFFRNIHQGLRGVRARREALPSSEYTLRRALKDLGRWCIEAVDEESDVPSTECRLFLVDRLGRELETLLDAAEENDHLAPRLGGILRETETAAEVEVATWWCRSLREPDISTYVAATLRRLRAVKTRLAEGA